MSSKPSSKKELSDKLNGVLEDLERIMQTIDVISDDLHHQHMIETGEIDLDKIDDFMSR